MTTRNKGNMVVQYSQDCRDMRTSAWNVFSCLKVWRWQLLLLLPRLPPSSFIVTL